MTFKRYAIYWTPPPDSPMAVFSRRWFGTGEDTGNWGIEQETFGLPAELARKAITRPRRYTLHATIKAPFTLAPGESATALGETLAEFCSRRRRPAAAPLQLHRFPRYLALVPSERCAELEWLAAECVTHFDRFRAPLTEVDRLRRSGAMSGMERRHLEEFGYPHIFARFFFHITLAGPLAEDELARVEEALAIAVEPFTRENFVMEGLNLLGDPGEPALFEPIAQYRFMR